MPLNIPTVQVLGSDRGFYVEADGTKLKKRLKTYFETRGEAQLVADQHIMKYRKQNGI